MDNSVGYSYDEVYKSTLDYFHGDDLAATVWIDKYCLQKEDKYYELTPEDMHQRLAKEFARVEQNYPNALSYDQILEYFQHFKYIVPQGSVMSLLGNTLQVGSLSNCVTLPKLYDSYSGIMHADQQLTALYQRRCVTKDTWVMSNEGPRQVLDLIDIPCILYHDKEYGYSSDGFFFSGEKEIYEIDVQGYTIKVSGDHLISTSKGWKSAKEMLVGDEVDLGCASLSTWNGIGTEDEGYVLGFLFGDGWFTRNDEISYSSFDVENDEFIRNKIWEFIKSLPESKNRSGWMRNKNKNYSYIKSVPVARLAQKFGMFKGKKCVNEKIEKASYNFYIGFLRGVMDADGSVLHDNNNFRITLKLSDIPSLKAIQRMLSRLGIYSKMGKETPATKEYIQGRLVNVKSKRTLIITGENRRVYSRKIGFLHKNKQNILMSKEIRPITKDRKVKITSINVLPPEKVFDVQINNTHIFDGNGIKLHNCGVGLDLSTLRPKNFEVNNSAKTSTGPVSFMERFSNTTREVSQLGRRGALSLTMKIDHPDIQDFLTVKNNLSLVTGANISPLITNDFMRAVNNGGKFYLKFGDYKKEVDAKQLWDVIVDSAWKTSEPGLIFWDTQHHYSTSSIYPNWGNVATNPCFAKDTLIVTREGLIPIKDLVGKNVEIYSNDQWIFCNNFQLTGTNKSMLKVQLQGGSVIRTTYSHEYILEDGTRKQAKDLLVGNKLKTSQVDYIINKPDYNKIVDITDDGIDDEVYCCNIPNTHSLAIAPGIEIGQCMEICMSGGDSCRLIIVNFYSFVNNPFTSEASFNYEKLYQTVYDAQRLMDDLVDLELEHIDRILEKIKSDPEPDNVKAIDIETWEMLKKSGEEGRRTGLGFTGLADALASLGLKYDSKDGYTTIEKIMKTKCEAEFTSSVDMALERGTFDDFDPYTDRNSSFIKMMMIEFPDLYAKMQNYGRRNISISTVSPTGSVSLLTQTSSGIEPVYELCYNRRKKAYNHEPYDFVDLKGDKWRTFKIYHPKLKEWMDITGETDVEKSPYWKQTAYDINWEKRIDLQSIVQKYTTHSISSTINLPEDVTKETVGKLFIHAWLRNLKGVTIYRDKSRSGVLVQNNSDSVQITKHNAPKRPDKLPCNIHFLTVHKERYVVLVGMLEGEPFEVFSLKVKQELEDHTYKNIISEKYKFGFLVREKSGVYNLCTNGFILNDIRQWFENTEQESISRLISTGLRHGVNIEFLTSQLAKSYGDLTGFNRSIARVLKEYISDENLKTFHCENCSSKDMILSEGCLLCRSCGTSLCS